MQNMRKLIFVIFLFIFQNVSYANGDVVISGVTVCSASVLTDASIEALRPAPGRHDYILQRAGERIYELDIRLASGDIDDAVKAERALYNIRDNVMRILRLAKFYSNIDNVSLNPLAVAALSQYDGGDGSVINYDAVEAKLREDLRYTLAQLNALQNGGSPDVYLDEDGATRSGAVSEEEDGDDMVPAVVPPTIAQAAAEPAAAVVLDAAIALAVRTQNPLVTPERARTQYTMMSFVLPHMAEADEGREQLAEYIRLYEQDPDLARYYLNIINYDEQGSAAKRALAVMCKQYLQTRGIDVTGPAYQHVPAE